MFKKVIISAFFASIVSLIVFYVVSDLIGSQMLLGGAYGAMKRMLRHPNLLSKDTGRIAKYFVLFFLTNALWSYVFVIRQSAFEGSGVEKGLKFFFLLWILTIPLHFWYWIMIPYPKKLLLFNVFVYYLVLSLSTGAVVGKLCGEKEK